MPCAACVVTLLAACDGRPDRRRGPARTSRHGIEASSKADYRVGRIHRTLRGGRNGGSPCPGLRFIESIHFKDGQIIKQGDLLFVIDPRPYRIAVEQAKADVERAQAKLEIASHDVDRAAPLARNQTITDREFDTRKSAQRDAAGGVSAAEAALKQAELNLEWTSVRAPISGRISDRRVDAGNLIVGGSTGATLLSAIVSLDPIHFVFDGSEADFIRYLRLAAGRKPPVVARRPEPRLGSLGG